MKVLCFLPDTLAFQNKLGMLTRSAGVNFQPCENISEVYTFAEKETDKHFFLFADSKNAQFLYEFSKQYEECKIIVILLEAIQQQMHNFLDRDNIESFVATNEGEFDARELILLLKKFQSKKSLGLDKYLNFPAIYNEKKILNSSDKKSALTMLEGFVVKIGGKSSRTEQYSQRICDLADELLLNAIFDANPRMRDSHGNQTFQLNPEEMVKIKWGFDGEVFGLSVTDPFGALSRQSVLKYLDGKQKRESFSARYGGGLGVKVIYERLHHYIVNVRENKMTEIICLLRFDKRFKDFEKKLRSFHYFRIED